MIPDVAKGFARDLSLDLHEYALLREALGQPIAVSYDLWRNGEPACVVPIWDLTRFERWRRLHLDPAQVPFPLVEEAAPSEAPTVLAQAQHFLNLGRADATWPGTMHGAIDRAHGRSCSRESLHQNNAWLYELADDNVAAALIWGRERLPVWALRAYQLGFTEGFVTAYHDAACPKPVIVPGWDRVANTVAALHTDDLDLDAPDADELDADDLEGELLNEHLGDVCRACAVAYRKRAGLYPSLYLEALLAQGQRAPEDPEEVLGYLMAKASGDPVEIVDKPDGSQQIAYAAPQRPRTEPQDAVALLNRRIAAVLNKKIAA